MVQKESKAHPPKSVTCHGYPFFHRHEAFKLHQKDVESRLAKKLKPAALQKYRVEYDIFPHKVFRGHAYWEERAQREKGYWTYQRNQDGREQCDNEVEEMKLECKIGHEDSEEEEELDMVDKWNLNYVFCFDEGVWDSVRWSGVFVFGLCVGESVVVVGYEVGEADGEVVGWGRGYAIIHGQFCWLVLGVMITAIHDSDIGITTTHNTL